MRPSLRKKELSPINQRISQTDASYQHLMLQMMSKMVKNQEELTQCMKSHFNIDSPQKSKAESIMKEH